MTNPIAGLMVGILATVLVQSSSTSTSIVVAMVSSGILEVRPAIPIVMGANIGTSVTNTIVALAQSKDRGQFELAFAGATVHDMFNWLAVIALLPLEMASGYLYYWTRYLVEHLDLESCSGSKKDFLKALTKPVTGLVVQLDKNVIQKVALGDEEYQNKSLLKQWCGSENILVPVEDTNSTNMTQADYDIRINGSAFTYGELPVEPCRYLFKMIPLHDTFLGLILLFISLVVLCTCLCAIVKVLNTILKGPVAKATYQLVNRDLPGRCSYFTGYIAILAGAGLTIIVQSSSVFTSTLTPLVGLNIISLERMYPLTLGSNIGTTTTGLLAAMAASGDKLEAAVQIAFVHLFFNISGILLFFPVTKSRLPIPMAKLMGRTTAKYRWFAVFYLIGMFFLVPGGLFGLSLAGTIPFAVVGSIFLVFIIFLVIVNLMKQKFYERLSPRGQKFLAHIPRCFLSLQPMDNVMQAIIRKMCCCCRKEEEELMTRISDIDDSFTKNSHRSLFDNMNDEEIANYQSTVRSLQEVKYILKHKDQLEKPESSELVVSESGYVTQVHTPYISKYPSQEDLV